MKLNGSGSSQIKPSELRRSFLVYLTYRLCNNLSLLQTRSSCASYDDKYSKQSLLHCCKSTRNSLCLTWYLICEIVACLPCWHLKCKELLNYGLIVSVFFLLTPSATKCKLCFCVQHAHLSLCGSVVSDFLRNLIVGLFFNTSLPCWFHMTFMDPHFV